MNASPDSPPPRPPRELEPDPSRCVHRFHAEGQDWAAWVAGKAAGGTGAYGLGMMEAVHFALAADPHRPLREALLARGRFLHLYDDELRGLLAGATVIVLAEPAVRAETRQGS